MSDTAERIAALSQEKRALLARRLAEMSPPFAAPAEERIAVVAAACRLPGGIRSPAELWQLLADKRDAIIEVPASRWNGAALFDADAQAANRINSRCGGFLDGLDRFDAAFFGVSPHEATLMDPQQRVLLELAWEALESAGQAVDGLAGTACGVFIGAHSHSSDYWLLQLAQRGGLDSHSSTGSAHSILANRNTYALDLRGPSMTIDTASSSSLVAVHVACQSLRAGESELALAGGVNLMLLPSASFAFSKLQILSPEGRCRSFDAAANGIVRSEGCGLVVLKRLSDALRDGDPVLAVIAGSAVNQDGASNGLTAPSGAAQSAVIRRALAMAGMNAGRLGLIETHGTGTPLGDPVEVEALAEVIGPARNEDHRCFLGALKTNLGHMEAAAGIGGLIKAVLCLQKGQVPANLHFTRPNPHLKLSGTPFAFPTSLLPWQAGAVPRVAAVSSFGFGGTNAHVVLEEHRAAASTRTRTAPRAALLSVSARSPAALSQALRAYHSALVALPADEFVDFIHTANVRRSHHSQRVAVVGDTPQALADRLRERIEDTAPAPIVAADSNAVWVYTGQGGLWPGMGCELFKSEPVFATALREVAEMVQRQAGWDLLRVVNDVGEGARLAATEVAQPALFAVQVGLTALWRSWGLQPGAVVGHSVGEVAAAHAAGVLRLEDAVRVVVQRSRAMQSARGHGRMAQVECPPEMLQEEITAAGAAVSIAALNGPASTVLSGAADALHAILARLHARGVVTQALSVEYAFHSAQMQRWVPDVVRALGELQPRAPALPLMSTVTGQWYKPGDYDALYWGRNLHETVLFAPGVANLLRAGFVRFLEIGPHPALGAGIHAQSEAADTQVIVSASLRRAKPARTALLTSLCELYESGASIDWNRQREPQCRVAALPPYPWQRDRYWLDAADAAALAFNVTGREWQSTRSEDATGCYELSWPIRGAPIFDPERNAAALQVSASDWPEAKALADEHRETAALERRSAVLAWRALRALGIASTAAARIGAHAAAACGVLPRHARLWQRLLNMAAEAGFLRAEAEDWVVTATGARTSEDASTLTATLSLRAEAVLLERCGANLAGILRGELDPLTLLFPPDDRHSAEQVYTMSPSARVYNRLAGEAVATLCRDAGRPLRVLEIGAGTGATTAALLSVLPSGSSYCFSDISPHFLHGAAARLGNTALEFTFCQLDIERSPDSQGFASTGFDLLVAGNVLHATADLRRALRHTRSLLAPGGVLLLIETVARRGWADLTFGLTEGWWRFDDAPLRSSDALLTPGAWTALLDDAGFEAVQSLGHEFSQHAIHPQTLLLARVPRGKAGTAPRQRFAGTRWLIVADRGGLGVSLAAALRKEGAACVCRAAEELAVQPAESLQGIVHCGALDGVPAGEIHFDDLNEALTGGIGSALRWAQRCTTDDTTRGARLWLLTRGAQRVLESDRTLTPVQSLLWGLGRSIALEHPEVWGGLVDLDPAKPAAHSLAALLNVLAAGDGEDQVAIRDGNCHIARLAPRVTPAAAPLTLQASGAYLITGGYGGLGPKVAIWLADQGARTIVLVGRSGPPAASDNTPVAAALRELRARGIEVIAERGDVTDAAAMRQLFYRLRDMDRPVRGVVHAVAAIRSQCLKQLTQDDLADSLRAKVQGSWLLHELTRDAELDFFVMFSSATTIFGAKGLAAYAAANQFLGALAWHRAALSLPATCIDWGAWGVIPLLAGERHTDVDRFGIHAMSDPTAFAILGGLVKDGSPHCMVANMDWAIATAAYQINGHRPILERLTIAARTTATAAAAPPEFDLRSELTGLTARMRLDRMTAFVRAELARVLGLPGPLAVDPDKGFFELGLDSLMAMQLRRRLDALTGLALPATVTFNQSSVRPLAAHVLGLLTLPAATVDAAQVAPHEAAPDAITFLSDSDVRRELLFELDGLDATLKAAGESRGGS